MILIIDFGSQTAHLIGRRLRSFGVPVEYAEPEDVLEAIKTKQPKGIILSGGPASVYEKAAPTINKKIFSLGIPILGICYGMQLTGKLLRGSVHPGKTKEFGPTILHVTNQCPLFNGIAGKPFAVWMSHGDWVTKAPPGFSPFANTATLPIAAMFDTKRKLYCVQFHPEVEHTRYGSLILRNFASDICHLTLKRRVLSPDDIIKITKADIGKTHALIAVSGGVDSSVAAAIVARAVGKQLTPIYIDSDLMRVGTRELVVHIFTKIIKVKPVIVDAQNEFLDALRGVTDPEEKRKVIGHLYIRLFERAAKTYHHARVLVQGTIYSDVIESRGTKHADKIKSHHNVGGLPNDVKFKIVEPLRELYKDEVRAIGKKLGLPPSVVDRQVFPGPGYAIRIIGEVTPERLAQEKQADAIVLEELSAAGWLTHIYMSFPVMTGAHSTAVKGDGRFFGEVVALRIIQSKDVMTTNWVRLPARLLQRISSRIVNEVPNVSRVVYDITTKPPATMEWE